MFSLIIKNKNKKKQRLPTTDQQNIHKNVSDKNNVAFAWIYPPRPVFCIRCMDNTHVIQAQQMNDISRQIHKMCACDAKYNWLNKNKNIKHSSN